MLAARHDKGFTLRLQKKMRRAIDPVGLVWLLGGCEVDTERVPVACTSTREVDWRDSL